MLNRIFLLLMVFCFSQFESSAQLTVTSDQTPEWYVQNVLLDPDGGVEATNVTFNNGPGDVSNNQCGSFDGGNSVIELCDGVILASGGVAGAVGPNNNGGLSEPADAPMNGDPDLEDLIPGFSINDISILEFDFVPNGDTLRFNYIFASEEYLEFVDGGFNDVFGFFLCGPGISGPFSTPDDVMYPDGSANLAIIPGTTIPVAIDNLNDVDFPEFYVVNGTGADAPFSTDDFYIQYDGLTVTLQAIAPLVVGETYHIKMAIADAGDGALDSGVFLEGGSFTTGSAGITAVTPNPTFAFPTLIEQSAACDTGFFSIFREDCQLDSLWYEFVYEGDAEWNVDYLPLPLDTIMGEGQTLITYPMYAVPDGEDEGTETINVLVYTSSSGELGSFAFQDTLFIDIVDNYTFDIDTPDITAWCPGDSLNIQAFPQATGIGSYEYTWTQDGVFLGDEFQILVPIPPNFGDSAAYEISAIDGCGMPSNPQTAWIFNSIPPAPTAVINTDDVYCRSVPYPLTANVANGTAPFTYDWSDGGTTNPNFVTPFEETEYSVIVTDNCGRKTDATGTIVMPDPVIVTSNLDDFICLDEILELSPNASGGRAPYEFIWSFDPEFGFVEYNQETGIGTVSNLVVFEEDENVIESTLTVRDWCQVQRDLIPIQDPIDQAIEIEETLTLLNCLIPNVITPGNGDNLNDLFSAEELLAKPGTMFIYDRWGKLMNESSSPTWDPDNATDGTYFYVVAFKDGEVKKGSFTILR